ncbi:MAG: hypothetical protein WCF31_00950 [Candidatus Deferrimicrobiaceae bacterium]
MRKALVVLVAVLGVAGLVTVGSAHMGNGGPAGTQGYRSGYGMNGSMGPGSMGSGMGGGWMGQGMGPGSMGSGMGPGSMHSGTGGGWMSQMGRMFGTDSLPHTGFNRGRPAGTPPAAPDSTTR